ncbi:MAG: biotin/lipoyl-containing protein, partial [Desulforhopalus sp.]
MTKSFLLPDLGEGVHEAEILAIPVVAGQKVTEGDIILEIETDKAAVEIPSPFTGTINEIQIDVGDTATVGDVLITFTTDEEQSTKQQDAPAKVRHEPAKETRAQKRPVPASPSTRRLAREMEVDLHEVPPSGPGGVVTKNDVENFARQAEDRRSVEPGFEQEKPAKSPAPPA